MLGLLRFVLAMFVVVEHLTEGMRFFAHWGIFAVFGFYLVSGYLITVILHETYSFRLSSFALNRFLRLFPIYYFVVIASAGLVLTLPNPDDFHAAWVVNDRLIDYFGNGLIVPFEFYDRSFRLVPPAWSVAVELINYFLLWLIVARTRSLALVALFAALSYHVVSLATGMPWSNRYFPFYAAILPFSLGACIYFFRDRIASISSTSSRKVFIYSLSIWSVNLILCGLLARPGSHNFDLFFYINLLSLLAIVSCLTTHPLKHRFRVSGKALGDLAYPVFLTHWIVGFAVSYFIFQGQRRGLGLFAASVLPILLISFVLSWLADKWLEPLRNKVRDGARQTREMAIPQRVGL
ncbi:MAG: acyltransferase [Methylococcaceae bacterium]|nr:acyltransferase [Methylococcaceae bacterium]